MHGFTLLLPAGWSQYLLVAFAYAGALIAGLRERQSQSREAGVPNFPEHYGSICKAGAGWADDKAKEEERRWSRKPPGKRAKWEALGTRCPFRPDWVSLIQNLAISEEEAVNAAPSDQPHFWLIREPLISLLPHIMTATDPAETLLEIVNAFRAQRGVRPCPLATRTLLDGALLHVRVALRGRGSPGDMTEIYGLSSDEIGLWEAAQVQSEEVGRVWIAGEGISAVQELGERETDPTRLFGWTNTGNFSLSRGAGHALATVTLRGYIEQVKQTLRAQGRSVTDVAGVTPLVKIRNRDGHLCRYASLSIV